jgi:hypothetical protein
VKIGETYWVVDLRFDWVTLSGIDLVQGRLISFDADRAVVEVKGWVRKDLRTVNRNLVFSNREELIERLLGKP